LRQRARFRTRNRDPFIAGCWPGSWLHSRRHPGCTQRCTPGQASSRLRLFEHTTTVVVQPCPTTVVENPKKLISIVSPNCAHQMADSVPKGNVSAHCTAPHVD